MCLSLRHSPTGGMYPKINARSDKGKKKKKTKYKNLDWFGQHFYDLKKTELDCTNWCRKYWDSEKSKIELKNIHLLFKICHQVYLKRICFFLNKLPVNNEICKLVFKFVKTFIFYFVFLYIKHIYIFIVN